MWLALTGAFYAVLAASVLTGVYHPFAVGEDRTWLVIGSLALAQVAIGASWRTRWAYAMPVLSAVGAAIAVAAGATGFTLLVFGSATLAAVVLVAVGRVIATALRRSHLRPAVTLVVPVAFFAVAALPLAEAAKESRHLASGYRVPGAVAKTLPIVEFRLNGMCGTGRYQPPATERSRLESEARALAALTRRHPEWIVNAIYYSEDQPGERHELMTVRQLAQNQLANLREFPGCNRPLQRALEGAIG